MFLTGRRQWFYPPLTWAGVSRENLWQKHSHRTHASAATGHAALLTSVVGDGLREMSLPLKWQQRECNYLISSWNPAFFLRGIERNSYLIKDPSQGCWTTKHHPTSQVKLACKWLFSCSSPKQKLSDYTVQLGAGLLGGSAISQRDASSSTPKSTSALGK